MSPADQELRERLITLVMHTAEHVTSAEHAVKTAELFYAFVTGNDSPAASDALDQAVQD